MALTGKDSCIHLTSSLKPLRYIKQLTNRAIRDIFESKQRNSPFQLFQKYLLQLHILKMKL